MQQQPVDDLKQISSDELELQNVIGTGEHTTVHKGRYGSHDVAVKELKPKLPRLTMTLKMNLREEAEKMMKLNADRVVRLYGICIEPDKDKYYIIMEYMANKDLRQYLDKNSNLLWPQKLKMASDGARGLFQIHDSKPNMLHRCISSKKFLVDQHGVVKVSDMGFALTKSSAAKHKSSGRKSTVNYIAPEHFIDINTPYIDKSEVYSYGIVMWEIATQKWPFKDMTDMEVYKYVAGDRKIEPIPDTLSCPSRFQKLINDCRAFSPGDRPQFRDIVQQLEQVCST